MIEKVNPGHPDKLADRIAGAIVEEAKAFVQSLGGFEKLAEWGLF